MVWGAKRLFWQPARAGGPGNSADALQRGNAALQGPPEAVPSGWREVSAPGHRPPHSRALCQACRFPECFPPLHQLKQRVGSQRTNPARPGEAISEPQRGWLMHPAELQRFCGPGTEGTF